MSASRPSRTAPADRDHRSRPAPSRSRSTSRRRRRSSPSSRPGAATSRSRPTSPRRSPASGATRRSRDPAGHADAAVPRRRRSRSATAIRETLAGAGLTEVVTHALVSPRIADAFRWESRRRRRSPAGRRAAAGRSSSRTRSRRTTPCSGRSLAGSLVEVVSTNLRHGVDDVAIFEIGKGYGADRPPDRRSAAETPAAPRVVAAGPRGDRGRRAGRPQPARRPYDLDDAKGAIELLAARLGFDEPTYRPGTRRAAAPSRAGPPASRRRRDGALVLAGVVGELHPSVAEDWDLRERPGRRRGADLTGLGGGQVDDVDRGPAAALPGRASAISRSS